MCFHWGGIGVTHFTVTHYSKCYTASLNRCCLSPEACRTSSGRAPPLIPAPARFPRPYSSPPRFYCPGAVSMRPPPSTTQPRGPCTISSTRAVSRWHLKDKHFGEMCVFVFMFNGTIDTTLKSVHLKCRWFSSTTQHRGKQPSLQIEQN